MHISPGARSKRLVKLSDMVHNQGSSHKVNFLDCCLCSEVTRQCFCHRAEEAQEPKSSAKCLESLSAKVLHKFTAAAI